MNMLTLILALFIPVTALSAGNEPTGTLTGRVVDESGAPLPGAEVFLRTAALADTTGGDGHFRFEDVPAGTGILTVRKTGSSYTPAVRRVDVKPDSTAVVVVELKRRMYSVDEVVVVGAAPSAEQLTDDEPAQVDVVTRAEFEHTAVTVEDVIASTPGASIASHGGLGSFSEVSLRGSYTNQVQVYIDGMLLNEAVGGAVNLGLIPLANVERVEIWRSGAPARFGGDAVGGALNIVTRGYGETSGSASLGVGSFGTVKAHGVTGFGPADARLLVSLDGAVSDNDFDYESDNGTPRNPDDDYSARRRNNGFGTANALVKYRRLMGADTVFEISEHLLHSRRELPASQHLLRSGASLATTRNLFQSRLTWSPDGMPWLETAPAFHSIVTREHYEDRDNRVGWGRQDNIYLTKNWRGMLPLSLRGIIPGVVTVTPMAARETFSPDNRLEKTIPLSGSREHLGLVGDIALQTAGERLALTANIRRDRYFSDYAGQPNPVSPVTPDAGFHHFTNRQVGMKITPHRLVALRWNYSDNWRAPGLYELFGDRGTAVSSPDLKPEHVYKWDAGVRVRIPARGAWNGGRIDVVRFENSYRDLIQWYTTGHGFIESDNVGGAYVKGTELVWNLRPLATLAVRGNWTFQRSKVTDSMKSYHLGKTLPNRPERYGTCTVEYTRRPWSFSWTLDRKDAYFLDRANQPHEKYSGRTIQDIGVSRRVEALNTTWRLLVQNIGDTRTFDMRGMPKPGRSWMIIADYSP